MTDKPPQKARPQPHERPHLPPSSDKRGGVPERSIPRAIEQTPTRQPNAEQPTPETAAAAAEAGTAAAGGALSETTAPAVDRHAGLGAGT